MVAAANILEAQELNRSGAEGGPGARATPIVVEQDHDARKKRARHK